MGFEIGMEYAEDAEKAGISEFKYTEGLNGSPTFIKAMADIVSEHLDNKLNYSPQYKMKCLTCTKPLCRRIINPYYTSAAAVQDEQGPSEDPVEVAGASAAAG